MIGTNIGIKNGKKKNSTSSKTRVHIKRHTTTVNISHDHIYRSINDLVWIWLFLEATSNTDDASGASGGNFESKIYIYLYYILELSQMLRI